MKCYPSPTAINNEQELLCQQKITNHTPSGKGMSRLTPTFFYLFIVVKGKSIF